MRWLLYVLGALAALAAVFLLWEASYAVAVAWRTHSWLLWNRFVHGHELLLPLHAAESEWRHPAVQNWWRGRLSPPPSPSSLWRSS